MFIKNYNDIATSKLRRKAIAMLAEGIAKVSPDILMKNTVRYNEDFNNLIVLNKHHDIISGRMFVIGAGKAAGLMAATLEEIMGPEHITAGIVNSWDKYKTKKIKIKKAGHPWPDSRGVGGVEKMLKLKTKYNIGKKDLVICLLSGGGSAMLPLPAEGITLEDKRIATQLLTKSGADINEINAVRKHISRVKGGQLAAYFAPAKVVSIIISDVIGNDVEVISSGPTVPDKTTFSNAYEILMKYKLVDKVPASVIRHLERGTRQLIAETPKKLDNVSSYVIADNTTALEAMATQAKSLGYKPLIVTTVLTGETEAAAGNLASDIKNGNYDDYNVLLFGGETTVKIAAGAGQGGRNQHFVASFILAMKDFNREWAVASLSSDGRDYLTKVAGAIADSETRHLALADGLDIQKFLNSFNTYSLFKKLGENLIITGDTGTNVADLGIFIRR
jgi:hydroxypyruvate reductase/glycerate 2-kinase